MSARKPVPAANVRTWAKSNLDLVPAEGVASVNGRGRLHPTVIAAFRKANKGLTYEPKVAQHRTMTVQYRVENAVGSLITKRHTLATATARDLLSQPSSRRGRIAQGDVTLALEALAVAGEPLPV